MMSNQTLDTMIVVAVLLGLLVVTGVAIKMYDRKRKREDEALALQSAVSEALLVEPRLTGSVVTPTVHASGRRSPVTVEITGTVPRPEFREIAIQVVMRVMSQRRADFRIEDRTAVDPSRSRHAA